MTLPTRKPNRLAELIHRPGGSTIEEAVEAANANLAQIRGSVTREIEAAIAGIQALGTVLKAGRDAAALDDAYRLSNSIVGMAGVFGMAALGDVALSLCELIDRMKERGVWDGPATAVHIESLVLLRPGGRSDAAQGRSVVEALRDIVQRV